MAIETAILSTTPMVCQSTSSEVDAVAPPVSLASAPILSPSLLSQTSELLTHASSDALNGLLRRAEFFAPREGAKAPTAPEEELPLEIVPVQTTPCNVTVSTSSIYFSNQRVNTSTTRTFSIRNPNCCPVTYTISSAPYGFSISSTSGTIAANSSTTITVTFTPYNAQNYSGYLSINPGSQTVYLNGTGTASS